MKRYLLTWKKFNSIKAVEREAENFPHITKAEYEKITGYNDNKLKFKSFRKNFLKEIGTEPTGATREIKEEIYLDQNHNFVTSSLDKALFLKATGKIERIVCAERVVKAVPVIRKVYELDRKKLQKFKEDLFFGVQRHITKKLAEYQKECDSMQKFLFAISE